MRQRAISTHEEGETVLYRYDDGRVLVTDKRLVLGKENWPIEVVVSAELAVYQPDPARPGATGRVGGKAGRTGKTNQEERSGSAPFVILGVLIAIALVVLGSIFRNLPAWLVVVLWLAGIIGAGLFLWGLYLQTTRGNRELEEYGFRLVIASRKGSKRQYSALYRFPRKAPATAALRALQKAMSSEEA